MAAASRDHSCYRFPTNLKILNQREDSVVLGFSIVYIIIHCVMCTMIYDIMMM